MIYKNINPFLLCLGLILLGFVFICMYIPIWDYPDIIRRNERFLSITIDENTKFIIRIFRFLDVGPPSLVNLLNCGIVNTNECIIINDNLFFQRIIFSVTILFISLIVFFTIFIFISFNNITNENILYIQSAFLALSFPGVIYLSTSPTYETLFIFLAIFFIAIYNHPLKYVVLILCYAIDDSETYILIYFLILERIFFLFYKYIKSYYFLIAIVFLLIIYFLNNEIINTIGFFIETQKIQLISNYIFEKQEFINQTIFLRILTPFKSFLIMTPYNFLAPILTVSTLVGILIFFISNNFFTLKTFYNLTFDKHLLYSSLFTLLSIVLLIPTHVNGKYFVFVIPIIYKCLLNKFSFNSILSANFLLLILLIIDLVLFFGLYRLNV